MCQKLISFRLILTLVEWPYFPKLNINFSIWTVIVSSSKRYFKNCSFKSLGTYPKWIYFRLGLPLVSSPYLPEPYHLFRTDHDHQLFKTTIFRQLLIQTFWYVSKMDLLTLTIARLIISYFPRTDITFLMIINSLEQLNFKNSSLDSLGKCLK